MLVRLPAADTLDTIRGLEGQAAKAYFAALPALISHQATEHLIPKGRTKHPPKDRFNCLLSYGYALLFGLVHRSLIAVGLEPAFGYFHQPRSAAPPLVLDVMELFRTAIWDMPLVGSVNRAMWNDRSLFCISPGQIWLSENGKRQAIQLFETRLSETFKHPHTGTSVEYSRIVELECRLLEKEWSGYPGEFGQMRLR
jgi:CRISPR-associated protein Cas1